MDGVWAEPGLARRRLDSIPAWLCCCTTNTTIWLRRGSKCPICSTLIAQFNVFLPSWQHAHAHAHAREILPPLQRETISIRARADKTY